MKRIKLLISWLTLAFAYNFLLSACSDAAMAEQAHCSKPADHKQVFNGPESKLVPLCPFAQSGGSNSFLQVGSGAFRQPVAPLFAYSSIVERIFSHSFSQYNFYSKHILVRLCRTKLIFPFHYFW